MDKAVDKREYLKKYLSGSDKKKHKKKAKSSVTSKSKIIDDDIDLKNMRPIDENELDIYDLAEDAPQIAGIIDERPEKVRVMAEYSETKKWKVVTRDFEDVQVSAIHDDDSDYSPDRVGSNANRKGDRSDSDVDAKRRRRSDSDASPPRKNITKRGDDDDSDYSPRRKHNESGRKHLTQSPKRRPRRESDSRASPQRKRRIEPAKNINDDERSSKKTIHKHKDGNTKSDENRHKARPDLLSKTLDGKKAGLQNAVDMKKEAAELRRKQEESLSKLGDDVSGRGAATIMRDRKTGRKRDAKEEARQKREKDAKNAEIVEKYAVWGKGMKQIDDRAAQMKEDMHEMSKPVARYADDDDLEEMRRNEEREGDPMLEYMRSKRRKEDGRPSKPQYQGSFMPNRYNIRPGHKWDGVDRSNGYEKKLFEERNAKKARDEEAFKWSTEDM